MNMMQYAINEAIKGVKKNHGGPFGAAIIKNGKIISKSHNTVLKTKDPTSHAEINAIRKASRKLKNYNLSGCTLYTTCMPCPMCLAAIHWARIQKVIYGCTSKDAEEIGFDDQQILDMIRGEEKEEIKITQEDRQACIEVLNLWRTKKNKKYY